MSVADEVVGDVGRGPSVGGADAGRLHGVAVVADAILSVSEGGDDLVGTDDDDGLSASVEDTNTGSRSISSSEITIVSNGIAGHEGVVSSIGKTTEGSLLGSILLGENTSVQVIPLSLSLESLNETDLNLSARETCVAPLRQE